MNLVAIFAVLVGAAVQADLDPALPDYVPVEKVSGTLRLTGSDVMSSFLLLCVEDFRKLHPAVAAGIEGTDNRHGIAYVLDPGRLCPMSRELRSSEIESIEKKFGRKPVAVSVLYCAMAVIVHKDNPLESITLAQLDALFSSTRKRGHAEDLRTWGQLGLKNEWTDLPVEVIGRNSASSLYGMFKSLVLQGGEFKESIKEKAGTNFVGSHVSQIRSAIGYAMAYAGQPNKILALGENAVRPSAETVLSGAYPLAGPHTLVLLPGPSGEIDALRREFLRFVFSKQGQALVVKDGYFPLSATIAKDQLKKLGIEK